jgi:hypothetical protein
MAVSAPAHARPGRRWLVVTLVLGLLAIGAVVLLGRTLDDSGTSEQVVGSGIPITEARELDAFTSVDLAGANSLTVRVGEPQSVVVRADDNLVGNVTTRVEDGRLVIATTGSFTTVTPMSVDVTVPSLVGLALGSSGEVVAEGILGDELEVDLSGSGLVRATGSVERLDVTLSGSGDVELAGLEARDAQAVLSGTGRVVVHTTGTLDALLSGTGTIVYSGSPQVTQSVTGTGTISGS